MSASDGVPVRPQSSTPPKKPARSLFPFVAANYLLSLLLAYPYLAGGQVFGSVSGAVFAHLALLAQLGTVVLALAGILALLRCAKATRPLARPAATLLFTLLHFFLLIDGVIYGLFRFHLNSLVLNVLTTPGGLRSAEIPVGQIVTASGIAVLLLVLEYWFFGYSEGLRHFPGWRGSRTRRAWLVLIAVVLGAAATERALYVWGKVNHQVEITRSTRLIPFYQPLSLRRVERNLGLAPDELRLAQAKPGASQLRYPRRPLAGRVRPDAPNILWIVLDAWRADLLDPETTPRIWDFSRGAQVFLRHVSGGNCTRLGIFSMLYGLHGTYWRPFLNEGRGPVLIDKFKEAGYRFRILSSTSLEYPEFKRTAFSSLRSEIDDDLPGATGADRDAALVGKFGDFLGALAGPERFFAFLFLDGSHNPFQSPPEFQKFQPASTDVNFIKIRQRIGIPEIYNRYRNSVHYDDYLVGRVLDLLKDRNRAEQTLVVITSDHGHEFYEHGYFGYNGAFTPEEIDVPLVLFVPGKPPREYRSLTVHQDLPATILKIAGVNDDPAAYSVGRDLFDPAARPFALSCSFTTCALSDEAGYLVFGSDSETMLRFESRDREYRELDDPGSAIRSRTGKLSELLKEMRAFLR